MTFVAHSIVGATVAAAVAPRRFKTWQKATLVGAFVVLGNLPDLDFSFWGHSRYDISHSIFVNLGLVLVAAGPFLASSKLRGKIGGAGVVCGVAAAWLSHLLLDTFYAHGPGIAIYWPFSKARLALPIPFFQTLKRADIYFDSHSVRVFAIEVAFYGSFSVLFLLMVHAARLRHERSGRQK